MGEDPLADCFRVDAIVLGVGIEKTDSRLDDLDRCR
jgi:hypothetical protein